MAVVKPNAPTKISEGLESYFQRVSEIRTETQALCLQPQQPSILNHNEMVILGAPFIGIFPYKRDEKKSIVCLRDPLAETVIFS